MMTSKRCSFTMRTSSASDQPACSTICANANGFETQTRLPPSTSAPTFSESRSARLGANPVVGPGAAALSLARVGSRAAAIERGLRPRRRRAAAATGRPLADAVGRPSRFRARLPDTGPCSIPGSDCHWSPARRRRTSWPSRRRSQATGGDSRRRATSSPTTIEASITSGHDSRDHSHELTEETSPGVRVGMREEDVRHERATSDRGEDRNDQDDGSGRDAGEPRRLAKTAACEQDRRNTPREPRRAWSRPAERRRRGVRAGRRTCLRDRAGGQRRSGPPA